MTAGVIEREGNAPTTTNLAAEWFGDGSDRNRAPLSDPLDHISYEARISHIQSRALLRRAEKSAARTEITDGRGWAADDEARAKIRRREVLDASRSIARETLTPRTRHERRLRARVERAETSLRNIRTSVVGWLSAVVANGHGAPQEGQFGLLPEVRRDLAYFKGQIAHAEARLRRAQYRAELVDPDVDRHERAYARLRARAGFVLRLGVGIFAPAARRRATAIMRKARHEKYVGQLKAEQSREMQGATSPTYHRRMIGRFVVGYRRSRTEDTASQREFGYIQDSYGQRWRRAIRPTDRNFGGWEPTVVIRPHLRGLKPQLRAKLS